MREDLDAAKKIGTMVANNKPLKLAEKETILSKAIKQDIAMLEEELAGREVVSFI